jgi:hypothetical protein
MTMGYNRLARRPRYHERTLSVTSLVKPLRFHIYRPSWSPLEIDSDANASFHGSNMQIASRIGLKYLGDGRTSFLPASVVFARQWADRTSAINNTRDDGLLIAPTSVRKVGRIAETVGSVMPCSTFLSQVQHRNPASDKDYKKRVILEDEVFPLTQRADHHAANVAGLTHPLGRVFHSTRRMLVL